LSEDAANRHSEICGKNVSRLPNMKDATLQYTNIQKEVMVPFTVYADFECILQPIDKKVNVSLSVL